MPDEATWSGFFTPDETLAKLGLDKTCLNVADFGCGYGTFSIPAARIVGGTVYAFDIDIAMIEATKCKAAELRLDNIHAVQRDFVADGTGLPDCEIHYAMLFNILHCEQPEILLNEARRILKNGGRLGIMHWNRNPATPRGPSMDIRPRAEQCLQWAQQAGFQLYCSHKIDLPPYHYAWVMEKP